MEVWLCSVVYEIVFVFPVEYVGVDVFSVGDDVRVIFSVVCVVSVWLTELPVTFAIGVVGVSSSTNGVNTVEVTFVQNRR